MTIDRSTDRRTFLRFSDTRGFTMIEVVIALLITALVGTVIFVNHQAQRRASVLVRQMAEMQQQIRGIFAIMDEDIRLAGYNRGADAANKNQRKFGILDVGLYQITEDGSLVPAGEEDSSSPILELAYDFSRQHPNTSANPKYDTQPRCPDPEVTTTWGTSSATNDLITTGNEERDEPHFAYLLYEDEGIRSLGRRVIDEKESKCTKTEILADNIEAISFAYAFDNDDDGLLDTNATTRDVIWAVDSDGDGQNLDACLVFSEGVATGDIAEFDDVESVPAGTTVSVDKIRAVRIWVLASSEKDPRFQDTRTYAVGDWVINMQDSDNHADHSPNRRRLLMEHIVDCRNMFPVARLL